MKSKLLVQHYELFVHCLDAYFLVLGPMKAWARNGFRPNLSQDAPVIYRVRVVGMGVELEAERVIVEFEVRVGVGIRILRS